MKQPSQVMSAAKKHVILFLAANPCDTGRLALDRETRSIQLELKRSGYRDRFDFVTRWAAEPLDLLRELRELKPTIVHVSGHGARPAGTPGREQGRDVVDLARAGDEPAGVVFDSADGRGHVVTPEAFVQTLAAAGPQVRLVVLNACFTEPMAQALLAHVDCVVGMSGAIHNDAARHFAIGFYGGLGERESIAAAFAQGTAAINLNGLPAVDQPQLKVRGGVDASALILAAIVPALVLKLPCPYPGMRPYQADDAEGFHGRDVEVDELIGRMRAGEREIYVIGPSGSGKSSLVAAGLLRQLARGVSGLGPFVVRNVRLGERPATRLCEALDAPGPPLVPEDRIAAMLAHRGPSSAVLLVVDQLEELFTLASVHERESFLAALRALRAVPRCVVICALRADFFGALIESSLWPEPRDRKQLSHLEVSPLRGEPLREAIAAPAREIGVAVEPELVERLLADAASEPGILPLLQETLVQLWDKRTDQTLTLADYEALGDGERNGLAIALARRADATLRRFSAVQTDIARRILLRLISFGEGRSDTRRQQPRAQLCAAGEDAAEFACVLQTMVDARLLTVDEDVAGDPRVDLAHEIMISAWPTLAGWIRSHRVDEQRRRRLEEAATRWVEHGRGVRGLLDPLELAEAELWRQTESAVQLGRSVRVTALITASRAAQTRQRRRRRVIVGGVSLLGMVAVAVAAAALAARDQANEARRLAKRNQELVARSYAETGRQFLLDHRFQEAIPYLLAARPGGARSAPAPLGMMFWEAERHLPLISVEHQAPVRSAAFSPDGMRVVTASGDHTARVWDTATGKPLTRPLEHQAQVWSAAFSPDGTRVVTASFDNTAQVWDAATGKPLTCPLEHQAPVLSAAFSPDGTRVVTASFDNTARVWGAATGKLLTRPLKHQDEVWSAAFSPDGTRVVTASEDRTARVWDAATGKPITHPLEHQDEVVSTVFSPDGARVVTASWDRTARVWDAATGQPLTPPLEHQDKVGSAAFSPDSTRVVTASWDRTARVWDAATGQPLTPPLEHQDKVWSAAFSPDGSRVVTASCDGTARMWDAATGQPLTPPLEHQDKVVSAAFSPDGMYVITASFDNTARVWDAASEPLTRTLEHQDKVWSAVLSPDGARVVTASWDRTARVWDAATGQPLTPPLEHQDKVWSAAFSPDGSRVVTASEDRTARVWDAATGQPLTRPLEHYHKVVTAAFSPDGFRVVTASGKQARVWDATTGQPLTDPLEHQAPVRSAAFSPDGFRVVTASGKQARVWDAATGQPLTRPLEHQAPVRSAAFSPDGSRVVTASWDSARVWDAATGQPLTRPLEHQAPVRSAAFSPDGSRVVTASSDRTARVWDATTGQPLTGPLEHQGVVQSAAFSPDGSRVVTASWDNTARVWDATTGQPLTRPLEHRAPVQSAAFSPDGSRVVTASWDNTARVWDLPIDTGTLDDWSRAAVRSPFVLDGGVLVRRSPPRSELKPAHGDRSSVTFIKICPPERPEVGYSGMYTTRVAIQPRQRVTHRDLGVAPRRPRKTEGAPGRGELTQARLRPLSLDEPGSPSRRPSE